MERLDILIFVSAERDWYLAMSRLEAFEKQTPSRISQDHVDEFHEILNLFASGTGQDISVFTIADDKMKHKIVSVTLGRYNSPASNQYTKDRYCDENFFKRRLIEVRTYFSNFQPPHLR